ncbi:MAG: exonuclease SbcCD subunit D [Muribaculaceae bacterium]|nr:exonuclease SbcCD subunit D [Muribaculaceae bacterium]
MKLLHTSDWHLGHELYGVDRRDEFAAMLLNMRSVIAAHKPDCMIIAGDVFDTSMPAIDVQTLLANALVDFHSLNPDMVIIVTSGNHDSANRHEIFRTPWRALNVHAIGNIDSRNPAANIVEIPGKGYVAAVPFVNDRMLPDDYFRRLIDAVPDDNLPLVLTAHMAVIGADFNGHKTTRTETAEYVGNIRTADITRLASGYDYLALGHIHRPQFIHGGGHHRVRYSGSPLAIGFDEAAAAHGVCIVTVDERGAEPQVETIEFAPLRRLVTLPDSNSFLKWDDMLELLIKYRPKGPELLRLNVLVDKPLPDNRRQLIADALANTQAVCCTINARRPESAGNETIRIRSVREFQNEDPLTIASEYAKFAGTPMTDEMTDLFRQITRDLENETD